MVVLWNSNIEDSPFSAMQTISRVHKHVMRNEQNETQQMLLLCRAFPPCLPLSPLKRAKPTDTNRQTHGLAALLGSGPPPSRRQ